MNNASWGTLRHGRLTGRPLGRAVRGLASTLVLTALTSVSACDDAVAPAGLLTAGEVGSVQGLVFATDGARITAVGVTLTRGGSTNLTASTDAVGRYVFVGVSPGVWSVEISVPTGFRLPPGASPVRAVEVVENQSAFADFRLERLPVI